MVKKAETKALTDAELESIAQDTRKMGHAEKIAYWDKRQAAIDPETGERTGVRCPNDPKHGFLVINGQGALMICGERKNGAFCTGSMPVSL